MLKTVILIPLIGGFLTLVPLQAKWSLFTSNTHDSALTIKSRNESEEVTRLIAVMASILTFIYSMWIWLIFDNNIGGFQMGEWIGSSGIEIGIDGIALYLIILTTGLTVIIIMNGPYDKEFMFWLLITESILIGVFSILDILYFYVLFEMVLIPLFFIMRRSIEIYPYRKNKINRAIYKLLGYTLFGSFIMLLGMVLLCSKTGNTNYTYLLSIASVLDGKSGVEIELSQKIIWVCLFIGFAVKVPVMPFHVWLPEAHSEAPTGVSMLLAGILLKLGTFGMMRYLIPLFPSTTIYFQPYVEVLFVVSVIYSSFTILRQVEIKKVIAYSSISHMNLCLLGIFSGEYDGIAGGYLMMINHGLISAGLFFCAGILFNRYSLRAIKYYRGLIVTMPLFSIFFFIFNLANIGFPPFASFISELLIFIGLFKHSISVSLFASLSIILGGAYGIWFVTRIIYGRAKANNVLTEVNEKKENKQSGSWGLGSLVILSNDLTRKEFIILLLLLLISLIFGLFPHLIIEGITLPISLMI